MRVDKSQVDKIFEVAGLMCKAKAQEHEKMSRAVVELVDEKDLLERCIEVFRVVANNRREALKVRIEKLLSYGLRVVFEEDYQVMVEYKKWGAGDRVYLKVKDENVVNELQGYRGGALVQITSFLVRLLVLVMYKPGQRRLFMADEVFGAVSDGHLAALSGLLMELSKKLALQLLLVTHNPALYEHADKVYEVVKVDGQSKFDLLR